MTTGTNRVTAGGGRKRGPDSSHALDPACARSYAAEPECFVCRGGSGAYSSGEYAGGRSARQRRARAASSASMMRVIAVPSAHCSARAAASARAVVIERAQARVGLGRGRGPSRPRRPWARRRGRGVPARILLWMPADMPSPASAAAMMPARSPCAASSVAAVFSPMPATPGRPSEESPRSVAKSAYWLGSTPYLRDDGRHR